MTVQGYGSLKMTGSNPSKIPDAVGDFLLAQDYIRDRAWLWDRAGALMQDIYAASGPILLSGGVVTDDGSHTKVNISAGIGYAPYTLDFGNTNTVPPATGPEDITALRVKWGALASQGNINVAGTWYVVMQYAETDWLTRVRAKAGGSWAFGKQPSYTLTISQTAPTAYQILLATIVSTGSAFTSITMASMNAGTQQYDLVVDSNAKLDLWCQAVSGQYKRVYIKAGTWTATALSPTAGVLINLDLTGTTYVFAEKGSSINYSASLGGLMYGLYHATAPTDMSVERFDNLKVNITNSSGAGGGYGFYNCTNLANCTGTGGSSGVGGYGFSSCTNLTNCTGTGTGSGSNGYGFSSCTNLTNCTGTGTASVGNGYGFSSCTNLTNCTGTGGSNGYGFSSCTNLTNCTGTGTGGGSNGYGFSSCTNLTNCTGTGTSSGSGSGYGFYACTGVVLCAGQGLSTSGTGYGFSGCHKISLCKSSGASKTSTFNNNLNYVDAAVSVPIPSSASDTAALGWNTP
jgi:hypothetical protein